MQAVRNRTAWLLLCALSLATPAGGQPARAGKSTGTNGSWAMEQVMLKEGRKLRGMILSVGKETVEFAEVRRPRGKPMYVVVHTLERGQIEKVARITQAQRDLLEIRVHRFRSRARVEAGRMESVQLKRVTIDGESFYEYPGMWFRVESSLGDQLTRRCVVRLEQMVLAFRQVLPPKFEPVAERLPSLRMYGTNDAYAQHLRRRGIKIVNPAYYDSRENLVAAGSDVERFVAQLERTRARHREIRSGYEAKDRALVERWQELNESLTADGVSAEERRKIKIAAAAKWEQQKKALEQQIKTVERKNQSLLDEMLRRMLSRLYHEAFHAYLENYVYRGEAYDVPRWLNEGLAQIFEAGFLEAGTLRVDAPSRAALARLQADLKTENPLSVADVIRAQPVAFLVPHRDAVLTSQRHYLYCWGLAYYLTFEQSLLGTRAFDRYISTRDAQVPPIARFEALIDMPLAQFERQWQAAMLSLKPPPGS